MWQSRITWRVNRLPPSTQPFLLHQKHAPISLQRRWATTPGGSGGNSSRHHFRAGAVESTPYQVKPNFNVPMWQPPARFMKYKAVRWLSNNLFALATYQLALEVGFTTVFGSLLYAEKITGEGVRDWLTRYHYPLVSWITLDDCAYTEPVRVGPFALNPQKMTALHTGHNIASGLLPVQVVLMLSTFSPVHRFYRNVRGLSTTATGGGAAAASAAAGGGVKEAGASSFAADGAAGTAKANTAPRRASYARAAPKKSPKQPF